VSRDPQESDWANGCPDDYWRRDAVALEMASDDPDETSFRDIVVSATRLDCKVTRTWEGLLPLARYCADVGPTVRGEHATGSAPLEDYPFDCSPWPNGFEAPKDEVSYGACYEDRPCPLGTECVAVQVKSECPPAGAAAARPARRAGWAKRARRGPTAPRALVSRTGWCAPMRPAPTAWRTPARRKPTRARARCRRATTACATATRPTSTAGVRAAPRARQRDFRKSSRVSRLRTCRSSD